MMPRHLAIGDVHGCLDALLALVDFVGIRDDDVVVTLGDYVDRGPDTCGVLDWLIKFDQTHGLVPLRGNHEIMMLEARNDDYGKVRWGKFGGIQALESYEDREGNVTDLSDIPDSHWRFLLNRLLPYYETQSHIFVHASVDPSEPMTEQSDHMLFWHQYSKSFPGHVSGKTVVCGHTSQSSGIPITNGHAICIDTAACRGGWLTCLDVESGTLWQANQASETRQMNVSELG
ncbi:Serine/threonine-protein phosphatase 1 [Rubripirellula amarantea]|uniref:Serine/threonine-protein phosphatase 1 n=2 Tax=Rubripirellula amarantea TaxID=2527999 RepID=A0A5C5WNQ0_9BACT|nr:Serine/threonine-protein phosphatase 1 [Rubripirellula amarantea]